MLGTTEIILIVVALFLLFGASRLPQLAKSLGQTRKAFKDGMREAEEESRLEEEQKRMNAQNTASTAAPQISQISDEELLNEARRRASLKQQS
jgi:sec-independent protein translocase protein TatA